MLDDKKDVGYIDDFIFYGMNAVASEHHAINSFVESKNEQWLEIASMIRRNRSKRLYEMVAHNEGQKYCFSKHILGMAMTLQELGNRHLEAKELDLAKECFQESKHYEALFKLLNDLKLEGGIK